MSQQAVKAQKKKRSNHFLPVCYQKAFGDSDGQIWVQYLHKEKPPLFLHPLTVGVMNQFYTRFIDGVENDAVENFFQTYVEDLYAPIAKRIREEKDEFTLESDDISGLLRFVASQVVRTYAHRLCLHEQAGIVLSSDLFIRNIIRQMHKILDGWLRRSPDIVLHTSLPLVGSYFITGDNPVISFSEKVDFPGVETPFDFRSIVNIDRILDCSNNRFVVPLSPYVCMTVHNSGSGQVTRSPQREDRIWVSKINQCVYDQSVQFVEARDKESLAFHVPR